MRTAVKSAPELDTTSCHLITHQGHDVPGKLEEEPSMRFPRLGIRKREDKWYFVIKRSEYDSGRFVDSAGTYEEVRQKVADIITSGVEPTPPRLMKTLRKK